MSLQSIWLGRIVAVLAKEAVRSVGGMRDFLLPRYFRLSSGDKRLMGVSPEVHRAPLFWIAV
jgi:hypothetical protein